MAGGGNVLRGQDGSLYFIRDEVLEHCKVKGEYVDRLSKMLEESTGEVEGFSFEVQPSGELEGSVGYVQGDILGREGKETAPGMMPSSTIMCPW